MQEKKERFSGVELLRILAACGVVMLHYNDGRAFVHVQPGSMNQMILFGFECLCICAVDLFILMSGYFLCTSQKRTLGKPLELIFQVIAFKEVTYLAKVVLGKDTFSFVSLLANLIPNNYFVILYIVVYFISPYVNVLLQRLTKRGLTQLMLLLLVAFALYPTLVDLSGEILGFAWTGLSSIASRGSLQGFHIVNFLLLYCVGAYLRLHEVPQNWRRPSRLLLALLSCVTLIFIWSLVNEHTSRFGLRSAWVYHNPLVILEAVILFLLFSSFRFKSKVINQLAKASFTCFLLHNRLIDHIGIEDFASKSVGIMLAHILVSVVVIYLLSWGVYHVYHLCTAWLFRYLNRIHMPEPELQSETYY